MKTISSIDSEIENLCAAQNNHDSKTAGSAKQMKQYNERLRYLRQIKLYLETKPSEDFLKQELLLLQSRKKKIDEAYVSWANKEKITQIKNEGKGEKSMRTAYNREMGLGDIQDGINTLEFILNG